jgi:dipicolinate synthase subunit A
MNFALVGGDSRSAEMFPLLRGKGHNVRAFALEKAEGVSCAPDAETALQRADCVILPMPVCARPGLLNSPLANGDYAIKDILSRISPHSLVCGGRIDAQTRALGEEMGLCLCDYLSREELAVYNAEATSEGALALIMQHTGITLWRARVLVMGFGRIGKLLAHKLAELGAEVTVSSRSCGDMAWCEVLGYSAVRTEELGSELGQFDVIVNTIPAPVLGEELLRHVRSDALCLDLASKPGGVDFAAAGRLGVRAMWALSLPGECAPRSAAGMILDTVENIIKERA